MKIFGVRLQEGTSIQNLTVASGTEFPSLPNDGELFYRSDSDKRLTGLYIYISDGWNRLASSDALTAPNGTSLPEQANSGDIFYRNAGDANDGLYVYNGSVWEVISLGQPFSFTLSGDVTGTIDGGTDTITLATVNSEAQTDAFRKITVNGKGLVTATSAVSTSDITTLVNDTYVNVTGDTMSGALLMPQGTEALPSLSFSADPDTGIFTPRANEIAITTNGTEKVRINSSGALGMSGENYGTSGQVLLSQGNSANPVWSSTATLSSVTYSTVAAVTTSTLTTAATTANQVVDTAAIATFRSAQYQIQVTSGSDYMMTSINVIHNGTTAFLTEYGTVLTGASLATFDVDISGGNLRLLVTPVNAVTTIEVLRAAMNV